jgi:hypothetical protein
MKIIFSAINEEDTTGKLKFEERGAWSEGRGAKNFALRSSLFAFLLPGFHVRIGAFAYIA